MRCALTWDDGPSVWTDRILDQLREHNAKATFFACGWAVEKHPAILQRAVREGHVVGNHSFTHPHLSQLTDEEIVDELTRATHAIYAASGVTPTVWRAPYFDRDDHVHEAAAPLGMRHVGATVDPADWGQPDPERIANDVTRQLYDGAVVVLHDGLPPDGGNGTRDRLATVEATGLILRTAGVEFVAVTDL